MKSARIVSVALLLFPLAAIACGATADHATAGDDANFTSSDTHNLWAKSDLKLGEENRLPNEEALFDDMADKVEQMQTTLMAMNGNTKKRGFHAKSHLCVKGSFEVNVPDDLPEAKVGIFAENKSFPSWVRYSSGVGIAQADKHVDVRGVAIKVMGAGTKNLNPGQPNATTQDFLMTNGPITPAPSSKQFVEFGVEQVAATQGKGVLGVFEHMLDFGGYLLRPENKRVRDYLLKQAVPRALVHGSLLGDQFWSGGAIALGVGEGDPMTATATRAIKFTTKGGILRNGQCERFDTPKLFETADGYFRNDLKKHIEAEGICIDFGIQFQVDPQRTPIEDTSVEWTEAISPTHWIARVTIPKVDHLESLAEDEKTCEQLSFSPWHAIPEHRALGNIMRARLKAYERSRQGRAGQDEPTR